MRWRIWLGTGLAGVIFGLWPASAGAETRTFLSMDHLYPTAGAGTSGPAIRYPSTIVVDGLSGVVTGVRVTIIGYGSASPDDTDMVIRGPNGEKVMLMSDACGTDPNRVQNNNWTFDDSAPTVLPDNGPCGNYEETSYRPSNHLAEVDNLSPGGGPAAPYGSALSSLTGGSPNGAWDLFVNDDNNVGFLGFDISGWALTLDIEQPAPVGGGPPETTITKGPKDKTAKRTATFEFSSSTPGSTFDCTLDGKQTLAPCTSPLTVKVKKGKHSFTVAATDGAGNADPTPASDSWKVKKKK